jgi:hypothetical protein
MSRIMEKFFNNTITLVVTVVAVAIDASILE